jgi:cyanate permease
VRRALCAVSSAGVGAGILGIAFAHGQRELWVWLIELGAFAGLCYPNLYGIAQIFAGPRASGSWIGLQNGIGNLAGIVGPALIGWTIDRTGSFNAAFVLSAAIMAVGAVVWAVVVPRIEPVVDG